MLIQPLWHPAPPGIGGWVANAAAYPEALLVSSQKDCKAVLARLVRPSSCWPRRRWPTQKVRGTPHASSVPSQPPCVAGARGAHTEHLRRAQRGLVPAAGTHGATAEPHGSSAPGRTRGHTWTLLPRTASMSSQTTNGPCPASDTTAPQGVHGMRARLGGMRLGAFMSSNSEA